MFSIYLTPASISYLTQFILALAITIFLAYRLRNRNTQLVLLTCFFAGVTVFIGLMFLDVALSPFPRLLAVYAQNTVLALALVFLLLFAYRFPRQFPRYKWESYAALGVSLAYLLWEAGFMVYRYVSLFGEGMVYYRPLVLAYANALVLLLVPVAFLRQSIAADPRPVNGLVKLWKPHGKEARGARSFVFIFAILFVLGVINVFRGYDLFSTTFYNISLSLGILAALWLFASTYINFIPGGVSVLTRLSILTLTLFLALLGSVGWLIAPPYIDTYHPNLTDHQTLRFTPNAPGDGYTVTPIDFAFETGLGDRLPVQPTNEGRNHRIDFPFPFYGQSYTQVYVASSGVIAMGRPFWQPNMQYHCANLPAIFPLMIDLDPDAGGGLYARQEPDRLILTWNHLPALYRPEAIFTFQTVLYQNGVFDITYNGLPLPFRFDPDETPSANPWVRGAAPGRGENLHTCPNGLSGLDDLPETFAAEQPALIQNYHLDFRQYLHAFILPLAWVVIGGSLLLMAGLPILLHFSIVKPLGVLTAGVRQMEAGALNVTVPVTNQDEIGFLTNAFNTMAVRLDELVTGLEERVTERTSELAAANRAKSIFLANMSHELRTPLNAILGFAQLLAHNSSLPLEHRDNLSIITASGEHLLALINQVLDLSKIEAGKMSLEERDFDLYRLLDDLEGMFQLRAAGKNLRLVFDRAADVPQYIRTDEVKLRQILINLLNNAVKFTREGKVILRVGLKDEGRKLAPDAAEGTKIVKQTFILHISVSDTGPGIASNELDHLFEAFSQTQTGLQAHEGTGLGLAISRHFVQLLGGEIGVESETGQGTTFTFTIPVSLTTRDELQVQAIQLSRRVTGLAPNQAVYRLLIVDDRWNNRQLLVKLLAPLAFELQEAENGQQALDIWQAWQPHLIWLDMRMPVLDGWETARRIKSTSQGQKTVVVALTASAFDEDRAGALAAGCDDFVGKPWREVDIFEMLKQHLGVEFVYEESSFDQPVEGAPNAKEELIAALKSLPPDWLAALEKAVIVVDMERIEELAAQIHSSQPALANRLTTLANKFEFKKISALIEAVKKAE